MAETDARAIDVADITVDVELPLACEVLGGERLVELDEIEVADLLATSLQEIFDGRNGAETLRKGVVKEDTRDDENGA